jgi:hypothetical protein
MSSKAWTMLMVLIPMTGMLQGCSMLGLDKGDKVEIRPASRTNETWGYLHQAEDLTGLKFRGSLLWEYRQATVYPGGKPAFDHPEMGVIAGWTANQPTKDRIHTEVIYGRDGKLGPYTGIVEAVRVVMRSNGRKTPEINEFLRSKGLPL